MKRKVLALLVLMCFASCKNVSNSTTEPQSITVSLDQTWEPETYRSGADSNHGALAIHSCSMSKDKSGVSIINVAASFIPRDPDMSAGECWLDLDSLGRGRALDLTHDRLEATLGIPTPLWTTDDHAKIAGGQLILESENADGFRRRMYGPWTDFMASSVKISLQATQDLKFPSSFTEKGFTAQRCVRLGLKLALNDAASKSIIGIVQLTSLKLLENQGGANEPPLQIPGDQEFFERLPSLDQLDSKTQVLAQAKELTLANPAVKEMRIYSGSSRLHRKVWKLQLSIPAYQNSISGRSAAASYLLRTPVNLTGKTLTAWVAVGPRLRGVSTRPNIVQFELKDDQDHLIRGRGENVSANAIRFDKTETPQASQWVKLQISEDRKLLGMSRPFHFDRVKEVLIRFIVGKHTDEAGFIAFPLSGDLLLSEIRVNNNHAPGERLRHLPALLQVAKAPVPITDFAVGINYPWGAHYGFDVGRYDFGGRDQCGFSSISGSQRLARDFRRFSKSGIQLVRVWIFADLRTGVKVSDDKTVVGLDDCVMKDIDALLKAASGTVRLIPVLTDFLIADGVEAKNYGDLRWREGEFPNLVVNLTARKDFVQKALRPVVELLVLANHKEPGLVAAIDVMNEPEHAIAVSMSDLRAFVLEVRQLVRSLDPGLAVTVGASTRDDMVRNWSDSELALELLQFHHYDAMAEDGDQSLDISLGRVGLQQKVLVGEVEPSDIAAKLDAIWKSGATGALFWSGHELDGYKVDLDEIRRWRDSKNPVPQNTPQR